MMNTVAKHRLKCVSIFLVILSLAMPVCWAGTSADGKTAPGKKAGQDISKAEAVEMLNKAVERAKATGSTVHIDLPTDPSRVEAGDLITVEYTVRLSDGALVRTTQPAKTPKKTDTAAAMENRYLSGPEEILAGDKGVFPGIGLSSVGLKIGEKKTVVVKPEDAFGATDPGKRINLPCIKMVPVRVNLPPAAWMERFNAFPVVGREVNLIPYFKARVLDVAENFVTLEFQVKDGLRIDEDFGSFDVSIVNDQIRMQLTPTIGAPFQMDPNQKGQGSPQNGRIVSTDGETFTVDFNHPLAGKDLHIDLEVVSLIKSTELANTTLPWMESLDGADTAARKAHKPSVLVLYASWCSWSKKLLSESLEDPRIKRMKDDFVWAKVDSDQDQEIKKQFNQNGFPLVVIKDAEGKEVKRFDGYTDAATLAAALKKLQKS
ncbi:MAG: thioredoxin family protein [Pseudomonadota bacterium]